MKSENSMKNFFQLLTVSLLAGSSMLALAKLPPPTDEQKAKAPEVAAKAAWAAKVDAYQLCKSQDKVAASYYTTAKAASKETKPAAAVPVCADPGAFVYAPPAEAAKPIEAAGAHSPTATAASPPSTRQPDAVTNPVNPAAAAKKP
jgi:hypothetical protein